MGSKKWTLKSLHSHYKTLHKADQRFYDERDRRYTSEAELRAMALRIKETADAEALRLARDAQSLKDQQNEQIRDESLTKSGIYATNQSVSIAINKLETAIFDVLKPITNYITEQKTITLTKNISTTKIFTIIGISTTLFTGVLVSILRILHL